MSTACARNYNEAAATTADVAASDAPGVPLRDDALASLTEGLTSGRLTEDVEHGCRRSVHRQEVSCSVSANASASVVESIVEADAVVDLQAAVGADKSKCRLNAAHDSIADAPEGHQEDDKPPSNSHAASPAGAQADAPRRRMCKCSIEDLNAEDAFQAKHDGRPAPGHSRKAAQYIKHTEPNDLLSLERLLDEPRLALLGFLARHSKNTWMQEQHNYVQKASIASAHGLMGMWRSYGEYVDFPGQWCHLNVDSFEPMDFLNCGWSRKKRNGTRYFFQCKQPEYCPSCNYQLRVKPACSEFLPAFGSAPHWYSLTAMATSDPSKAGVKMFAGYDAAGDEVYEPLVMLLELVDWPRLSKYNSQCAVPYLVSAGLWSLMPWLIAGHYFDGLHVAGENDFTYFPDPLSPVGVSHTINPHFHAYGNTRIPFDRRRALFLLKAALTLMHREGGGRLWAYPDIALRPISSDQEMKKAISYVFKPWDFAEVYIDALAHGCPLVGLNLEFHTTYFGSEHVLHPIPSPSGLSKWGAKLGNMTQRAGKSYVGTPLPALLSAQQEARFLARLARNEVFSWEVLRYSQHLSLAAKIREKRVRQQVREMEAQLVND